MGAANDSSRTSTVVADRPYMGVGVGSGLGRIVALCYRSSTLYYIH
jgi:hypothetical protein